jgi:hypothetical protein
MMSNRARLVAAVTLLATGSTIAVDTSTVSADITGYAWSSAGTIQFGTNSNMVGFWQSVGEYQGTPICPGTNSVDGRFYTKTVAQTKAMQLELATPPQPQTGVVNAQSWLAVQNGIVVETGAPRLNRTSGLSGYHGTFGYYNGGANSSADLYWQGADTGTQTWKFLPPGASSYLVATTARTMGSYPISCL